MNYFVEKIKDNGFEAYIVGGYVRDLLLCTNSYDIDICTNATIDDLIKIFGKTGKVNREYYSYHIKDGVYSYDITSYRKELKYENNKPIKIEYAKTLIEDLKRRDFTINSIVLDNDKVIDKLNGRKDLDKKLIKVIGNTYYRLQEDKTRILRAIRFYVTLDFELDKLICSFLKTRGHLLNDMPLEFKKNEVDKIFDSKNYYKFFELIKTYNLYDYLNIHIKKDIMPAYNKYGIYAQIDCDYRFSKKERKIINDIRQIVKKKNIDFKDIDIYSEEVLLNAAYILKKVKKYKLCLDFRKLNDNMVIDIDADVLFDNLTITEVRQIYRDIYNKVMFNKPTNRIRSIIDHLDGVRK